MTINSLDPSQKHALDSVLEDDEDSLFLIYGPPGTGKSQLLVSLLYEMAIKGKKILFVSQNTEALDVIDRKIKDLEKGMHLPDNHLSISDFSLQLYRREQRYLKYITSQASRLSAKTIPSIDMIGQAATSDVKSPLSYTALDRNANYSLHDGKIGADELLQYYMQYVQGELVVETIYDFNQLDIRKVLQLIDAYPLKDDFTYYNQPQNELRFIATNNPEVSLTSVQVDIRRITEIVESMTVMPAARISCDISDYLKALQIYYDTAGHLNLYKIQADDLDLKEFETSLRLAMVKAGALILDTDVIEGLELIKRPLFKDEQRIAFLGADSIDDYKSDLKKLNKIAETFRKSDSDLITFSIHDLLLNLISKIDIDVENVIAILPSLLESDHEAISLFMDDSRTFADMNPIARKIKGVPESFRRLLPEAKNGSHELILRNETKILTIARLLEGTNLKLKTLISLQKKAKSYKRAINLFGGQDIETILSLTSSLLRGIELSRHYGLEKIATFRELQNEVHDILEDVAVYEAVIEANRAKALKFNTQQLIKQINATVQHNLAKASIHEVYNSVGRYLENVELTKFANLADDFVRYVELHGQNVAFVCRTLTLKPDGGNPAADMPVSKLIETIDEVRSRNTYSGAFFVIDAGQAIAEWHDAVRNVRHFSSQSELDAYLQHTVAMIELRQLLLPSNRQWIDSILAEPSISFYDVSSRIVNSIVRTQFQNMPAEQRKGISISFFKDYARSLDSRRKKYYVDGLQHIRQATTNAVRFISNGNNWSSAPSTMEKIRANTRIITEAFPIVIATPKEVAKYISPEKAVFDFVIFDEASQLLPGQALPAIYRAERAVIVGDPHQMPPGLIATIGTLNDNDPEEESDVSDSILDLVKKMQPDNQYHLRVHYRSESEKLFEPSRSAIYAEDGIQPIYEAQLYDAAPIEIADSLGVGVDGSGKFDKNFGEIVSRMSAYLDGDPKADFCILFTTMNDANAFRDYLVVHEDTLGQISKLYAEDKVLISTVTNCQGIEGTYSILYMPHYDRPGAMWFFREGAGAYKRLNVAITRQRRGLTLLLADSRQHWLQACEVADNPNTTPNKKLSAQLLRSLLQNAGQVIDTQYLDQTLAGNADAFDSPLTEQLYQKLSQHYKHRLGSDIKIYCEVGWHMLIPDTESVYKNNKNIGFRIDIGIYSMKDKKFILGIEMDGAAYHTGYDKEHSDYGRQKVLEAKGWEIYRIWSTNWLNDQRAEFERLTARIDGLLSYGNEMNKLASQ